jgi:hypothetical protein
MKQHFASLDRQVILDKLAGLPISTWTYRTEQSTLRHIGPMAQDFMSTFEVGSSDKTILQVDADGVAFAAIQALYERLQHLERKNAELARELARIKNNPITTE